MHGLNLLEPGGGRITEKTPRTFGKICSLPTLLSISVVEKLYYSQGDVKSILVSHCSLTQDVIAKNIQNGCTFLVPIGVQWLSNRVKLMQEVGLQRWGMHAGAARGEGGEVVSTWIRSHPTLPSSSTTVSSGVQNLSDRLGKEDCQNIVERAVVLGGSSRSVLHVPFLVISLHSGVGQLYFCC